jgi:hypothetical protein
MKVEGNDKFSIQTQRFGCGLPRCVVAPWRLCVEILPPDWRRVVLAAQIMLVGGPNRQLLPILAGPDEIGGKPRAIEPDCTQLHLIELN